MEELRFRRNQLFNWVTKDKLISYCIGGFFNPQGFLFAVKQEEVRKRNDKGDKRVEKA